MAIVTTHVFETEPGQLLRHIERSDQARVLLQEMGYAAMTIRPIVGTDANTIGTVVNYADNTDYAHAIQAIQADERWVSFYGEAMSEPTARLIEASLFSDMDPTYAPAADRPLGVLQMTQWRSKPGRMGGFIEQVGVAKTHVERLGGTVRLLQCVNGKFPMTLAFAVTFEDFDHFGEYGDKLAADEQWSNFWAGAMSDPTADMIRSGLYEIVT